MYRGEVLARTLGMEHIITTRLLSYPRYGQQITQLSEAPIEQGDKIYFLTGQARGQNRELRVVARAYSPWKSVQIAFPPDYGAGDLITVLRPING